jgi:hypothetical protein
MHRRRRMSVTGIVVMMMVMFGHFIVAEAATTAVRKSIYVGCYNIT